MTVPEVIMCANSHYRKVMYGLGPYITDYEEQIVLVGIMQNWCGQYVVTKPSTHNASHIHAP